eukprot:GHVU01155960.1.p1 GENE.GHVU01155960.1~~GHVU01155960.1.p1  ORF type:complete len:141 (+),score=5.90 GHVU01155960.1:759-1181(+)
MPHGVVPSFSATIVSLPDTKELKFIDPKNYMGDWEDTYHVDLFDDRKEATHRDYLVYSDVAVIKRLLEGRNLRGARVFQRLVKSLRVADVVVERPECAASRVQSISHYAASLVGWSPSHANVQIRLRSEDNRIVGHCRDV